MLRKTIIAAFLLSLSSWALADNLSCANLQNTVWQGTSDTGLKQTIRINSVQATNQENTYGLYGTLSAGGVTYPFTLNSQSYCQVTANQQTELQIRTTAVNSAPAYTLTSKQITSSSLSFSGNLARSTTPYAITLHKLIE